MESNISYGPPPAGIPLQVWQVADEAEAKQIAGTFPAYLMQSNVIDQLYLFVVVPEQVALAVVTGAI